MKLPVIEPKIITKAKYNKGIAATIGTNFTEVLDKSQKTN